MNPGPEFWIIDDDTLYVRELIKALENELRDQSVVKFTMAKPVIAALDRGKTPAALIVDMMLPWDEWDNPIKWMPEDNPAKNGIAIVEKLGEIGLTPERIGVITAVIEKSNLASLVDAGILLEKNILIKPAGMDSIDRLVRRIKRPGSQTD